MMTRASTMIAALACVGAGAAVPATAQNAARGSGNITLNVTDLRSTSGQLVVCLFRTRADFPECEDGDGTLRRTFQVTGTTTSIQLPLPAAGSYAVTVFHDANGNGRLGKNFLGMPTEGVGVAGNPGGMPRYDRSQVQLEAGSALNIRMRYLFG